MLRKLVLVGMALATAAMFAQGPGGMEMTPAMKAKFDAWRKWRDNHKNVSALQRTIGGLDALTKDSKNKFTAAQAKTMLGVITKWKDKKSITDAQAREINSALTKPLTAAQIKIMAREMPQFGRGPGGPGGGPGGPGGAPGGQGGGERRGGGMGGRTFDPSKMPSPKDYNPLNPATIPMERMRDRAKTQLSNVVAKLKASAK